MKLRQIFPPAALWSAVSLSLGVVSPSSGQTTSAATVPVGFTQQTINPATDASTPSSQVFSVPFYNAAAFTAAVTSVDSATAFTSASGAWTANQYAQTNAPFLVHFKSGNSVGRFFLIASNTATQITVYPRGYNLAGIVAASDSFEIVPANTLGSLFGTGSVPFLMAGSVDAADNLFLWNGSKFDRYYHDGASWKRSGLPVDQNNTVLYPDEGVFMIRRAPSALTLTFAGTVPATTERSDVASPGSTFVSNRFPTNTTLAAVGFQALPGWLSAATATAADNVYLWDGSNWSVYFHDGANWRRADSAGAFDAQAVPTGSAMFVVRKSAAAGAASTLVQSLPYSL